jgi:hypothetical protein
VTVERALSVRNPWAALIISGNKLVENRVWDTRWRGTLAVQAGQKTDINGLVAASDLGISFDSPMATGYLGVVDLVGTHWSEDGECCGPWAEAATYHWCLENPRPLPAPIPGRGWLGLYACPPDVRSAIDLAFQESA